jgi:hypothetical protein
MRLANPLDETQQPAAQSLAAELRRALISPLLSDDTHLQAAWDEFCAKRGLCPGRVGHLGVARKPGNARA